MSHVVSCRCHVFTFYQLGAWSPRLSRWYWRICTVSTWTVALFKTRCRRKREGSGRSMLPMSTTRYVVKCEVTPPPGPWETLAGGVSEEVSLCGGGSRLGVLEGHCYPHAHWTVVNPFSPAVRRLAARVHVTLVCRGWRGSTNNNTTYHTSIQEHYWRPADREMLQKYCVYFSVSRGERAEYNHWVCFVRLRMIEDWLFVMNPVPLPPLVSKNVRSWVSVHVPGEQGNCGRRSVRGEAWRGRPTQPYFLADEGAGTYPALVVFQPAISAHLSLLRVKTDGCSHFKRRICPLNRARRYLCGIDMGMWRSTTIRPWKTGTVCPSVCSPSSIMTSGRVSSANPSQRTRRRTLSSGCWRMPLRPVAASSRVSSSKTPMLLWRGQSDTSSRTRRPGVACGTCTRTSSKLSPKNWAPVCMCEPGFAWGTYKIWRILYWFDGHWTMSP